MVMDCGREVGLAIETKHPTRYAGLVERRLAQVLREFELDRPYPPGRPQVRVMSFSALANARMRQLAPMVPLVYLIHDSIPLLYRDGSLPRGTISGVLRAVTDAAASLLRLELRQAHPEMSDQARSTGKARLCGAGVCWALPRWVHQ